MPIYQFQPASLLDEVSIHTNQNGGVRAYLHARGNALPEQLQQVQSSLRGMGWKVVPIMHEGKAVLEVRGFKKPEDAVRICAQNGWTQGPATVTPLESDTRTAADKLRNMTLKVAGLSYNLGDMAYLTYAGMQTYYEWSKESGKNFFNLMNIGAGIGYSIGSVALTVYAGRDQSQNTIQTNSQKVKSFLRKEGIRVEDDTVLLASVKRPERSFWGRLDDTLAKYPSETLNSVYVGVGGILSAAAFYRATMAHRAGDKVTRNEEMWDIGLGTVTAASALTGLMVKEKAPEEDGEKRSGLGAIADWVQEKPLRATGFGYMVATWFHAVGTYKKYHNGDENVRRTAVPRGIFVASNVVSEIMMALSSKGHGTGVKPDGTVDTTVIAATAELLMRQPAEKREGLITQLSGFMASRDVLDLKADDIAGQLRTQLAALEKNPWLAAKPLLTAPAVAVHEKPHTRVTAVSRHALAAPQAGISVA